MVDYVTIASNILLVMTLVYCVILERRIRTFRSEARMFQSLLVDLTRSTESAQTVITALRSTLNDAQSLFDRTPVRDHKHHATLDKAESASPQAHSLKTSMSAKDLAQYFAERRLFSPALTGDRE